MFIINFERIFCPFIQYYDMKHYEWYSTNICVRSEKSIDIKLHEPAFIYLC